METQYSGDNIVLIFPDGTSPALLSCLIAGIPLKDVHALNYLPGELRDGVNMDNTKQLFKKNVSSPQYTETLTRGKVELNDLYKEEGRRRLLAAEEDSRALKSTPQIFESSKAVSSEREEMQRHRHRARKEDGTTEFEPDFFSMGAAAGMVTMATWKFDTYDPDESEAAPGPILSFSDSAESPSPKLAYANATGASAVRETPADTSSSAKESISSSASNFDSVQMTAENLFDSDGMIIPNTFVDVEVASKRERIEAAERAMEEYLSQGDGSDEWLDSMLDIMED